jgi:surface protein
MSFRNVQQNTVKNHNLLSVPAGALARGAGGGWIRNPSWLAMPAITAANEEVDMLVRINPESNFIAFQFYNGSGNGNILVDWGDGTSGVFTQGTIIQKQYDYTTAALANTNAPVTFQQSGSTVTRTSHGYPNGYPISFFSITTTTGITASQTYYVINATTNTFQLAASRGGTALTLTNDGTGIILPYKQAIIKVNSQGSYLQTITLNVKNTTTGLQAYASPIMDLTISARVNNLSITGTTTPMSFLERINILRYDPGGISPKFGNSNILAALTALQSISLPFDGQISAINNTSGMFQNCISLQTAPYFNMANIIRSDNMFQNCRSLQTVPLYNTINNANLTSMFDSCTSLQTLPLLNTSNATNMTTMFNNCVGLQTLPTFNTINVTNMTQMFASCTSLQTSPLFNTSNVTNVTNMFQNCSSLQTVPQFNLANLVTMTNMFSACASLQSVPLFNTSKVTDMTSTFQSCTSLQSVPLFDTSNVLTMTSTFTSCQSLQSLPVFNTANVSTFTTFVSTDPALQTVSLGNAASAVNTSLTFSSCPTISSILLPNLIATIDVSNCKLSGPGLDALYTSLGRVGGSVTFQASPTNTVTIVGHGYSGGESIRFSVITTTTGISINTTYWVRNVTTDTFQLSATPTGAILTLTNNGTGTRAPATVTVSGNWGIATDTPSIATAKGWTVTGS